MEDLKKLEEKLEEIYQELESENFEAEQDLIDFEQNLLDKLDFAQGKDRMELKVLLKKIKSIKKEFDFYDEDAELVRMFPNGQDDDSE